MTTLVLVAAVARNGIIGRDGVMPWHLPEDLAHFRRTTQGLPVLMGRRTWESLPERFRPLPGRRNIVVTRQAGWVAPGAEVAASPEAALALMADAPRACVIGGGELYAALLPRVDELVLTEIDADFDGDTRLPATLRDGFTEVAREAHQAAAPNDFGYAFVTYRRG
ncbi:MULTISPECIES: dihydrofolate reductase [unclassified Rubrivivax]|uniref:dihydrofolate reductase n=1 Tax=unclassified Rubrivivax TaxID=2649762 RepID=UPI001E471031|nr:MULTISPECIES: dihydrofolate reductase [unclassified Rubrivivax]MCC9595939.1 dihydrofolate reductase [Rubrivivax sp. JA1055]MCC9647720.1 dihydrofolate reductase [Rubrivivax sp. JA1029]